MFGIDIFDFLTAHKNIILSNPISTNKSVAKFKCKLYFSAATVEHNHAYQH